MAKKTTKTTQENVLNSYILLDRSGSMTTQWDEALGAINGYVDQLKTEGTLALVNVIAFDTPDTYKVVREAASPAEFKAITKDEIQPRGMTPLYDAAGTAIMNAMKVNAEKTVFVIMTDGQENASQTYNQAALKTMIKMIEARGWEILFLGANFDVQTYTESFGLAASKFVNTVDGTRANVLRSTATMSTAYANSGVGGMSVGMNYTADVKAAGMGTTKKT